MANRAPNSAAGALVAALGVAAGFVLDRVYGWQGVAVAFGAMLVLGGAYLLVHRYRYGRWSP